jgi:hypothetical protein
VLTRRRAPCSPSPGPRAAQPDARPAAHVEADWIDDPDYGDTIGRIDWESVLAVTWRWSQ